jgi:hypothetical protein
MNQQTKFVVLIFRVYVEHRLLCGEVSYLLFCASILPYPTGGATRSWLQAVVFATSFPLAINFLLTRDRVDEHHDDDGRESTRLVVGLSTLFASLALGSHRQREHIVRSYHFRTRDSSLELAADLDLDSAPIWFSDTNKLVSEYKDGSSWQQIWIWILHQSASRTLTS